MRLRQLDFKGSDTARMVMVARYVAWKAGKGPDYLAKVFIRDNEEEQFLSSDFGGLSARDLICMSMIRTEEIDKTLSKVIENVSQVVVLGAGYDTRSLRFQEHAKKNSVIFFEVDHPNTQDEKLKVLRQEFSTLPDNVVYVPIDFENQNVFDKLVDAGFRKDRKTFFILEGVSSYLTESAVKNTLQFVSQCAVGSSIWFDALTKTNMSLAKGLDVQAAPQGEPINWRLGLGTEAKFLHDCGLELVESHPPDSVVWRDETFQSKNDIINILAVRAER